MADFTLQKTVSGSSKNNAASRVISSYFTYSAANHKRITGLTRRDGIWCSCGGSSQSVRLSGYDKLIDTATGAVIKKSNTGTCTCHGTGPANENYMTCSFTNWTDAESKAAISAWAAGTLKITRTVSITSYTSSDHGSPTFRDGYYNDVITINGNDVPYTNYGPKIVSFSVKRSSNGTDDLPTSTKVYAKIRLSMTDSSGLADSPGLAVRYSNDPNFVNPQTVVLANTQSAITPYLSADTTVLIGSGFSIGSTYYFRLAFTAGEEASAPMMASVGMSNVPVHIPDNNCGFSVGGYSNATPGDERFEAHWQGFFHAGIHGVTNFTEGDVNTGGHITIGGVEYPVYRYVYRDTTSRSGGTARTIFTVPNMQKMLYFTGGWESSGGWFCPLNYYISSSDYAWGQINGSGEFRFRSQANCAEIHVIVYYAKVPQLSAPLALSMLTGGRQYDDEGEEISDEEALNIITGGESE